MKRSVILPLLLVLIVFISCGFSVAQTYVDSLPNLDEDKTPTESPTEAPHAGVMYLENVEEPPCMETNDECIDDQCSDHCQKNHGQDGNCMALPNKNLCCCGM
ncbi:unnamed protein product [Amaranthus hypochondriacus]